MRRVGMYSSVIVALSVLAGLLLLGTGCASSGTADEPVKRAAKPAATKAPKPVSEAVVKERTKDERAQAENKDKKKASEGADKEQSATEKKAAKKVMAEKETAEKVTAEKEAAAEKAKKTAEQAVAGRATAEQYANEQAAAKQYTVEQASTQQAVVEQATAEEARREARQAAAQQAAVTQPAAPQPTAAASGAPAAPSSTDLYLTVPKMGLYDAYVANTSDSAAMDNGAIKLPETGFPWEPGANTYIAGHVLGYQGTGSYMQFAELPNMAVGDEVLLKDANGTTYTYRVSEVMTVSPYDTYVTTPVPGRTMVTLQTCVNPPAYDQRLVVRADLVS